MSATNVNGRHIYIHILFLFLNRRYHVSMHVCVGGCVEAPDETPLKGLTLRYVLYVYM